VAGLSRDTIA